ncbi:hypothetical protein F5Y17DRAFT_454532 [Xylariaceae sp. FL0594]|nr:hypothetical protein F5Y17DRAFT_454532 [Xylariaceae sp. FL0594]
MSKPLNPRFFDARDIETIRALFKKDGIVFIVNCSEKELEELAQSLGEPIRPCTDKEEGSSFVSHIRNTSDAVGKGETGQGKKFNALPPLNLMLANTGPLPSAELFFHTERSGWDNPPRILATVLTKATTKCGGGHSSSLFVDGREILERARGAQIPFLYNMLVTRERDFCPFFRADDGTFVARPFIQFLNHRQEQAHQHGSRDSSKGCEDEKRNNETEEEFIFRFQLGDSIRFLDTVTHPFLRKLEKIIWDQAFCVELKEGQGYLVDNHRFLHGRTAFEGDMEIMRVLAYSF